jgi:hypothetical protein
MLAFQQPGATSARGPTRWCLAALLACVHLVAAPTVRCAQVAPREATSDELEGLLIEARQGRVPHVAAVDDALSCVPPEAAGRFTGALLGSLRQGLGETHEADAALLQLVAGFPRRALARLAVETLPPPLAVPLIDVGLAILLANPDVDSITTATELAGERLVAPEGAREARRRLQAVLEAALLRDERRSRRALERAYADARSGLESAFVDALRAIHAPRRLQLLVGLLGVRPGSDGLVLNRVHGVALRLGPVLDEVELRRVRSFLESSAPFERLGAALAAGALQDRGALDALVELLLDPVPSVRNAAHDSLRHLSAMTIGSSPERWRAWVEREMEWWQERGERDLARLNEVERADALVILREAAHHRLFREEIAAAVVPLLEDPDTTVVRIALATLEGVRARGIELVLVGLLEHPSREVRDQAAGCLRHLTGRRLPADPFLWRRVLGL